MHFFLLQFLNSQFFTRGKNFQKGAKFYVNALISVIDLLRIQKRIRHWQVSPDIVKSLKLLQVRLGIGKSPSHWKVPPSIGKSSRTLACLLIFQFLQSRLMSVDE